MLTRSVALSVLVLGVGCSAAPVASETQRSAETRVAAAGAPLVECWLEADDVNHRDMVACGMTPSALTLPVKVSALSVRNENGWGADVPLDPAASARIVEYDPAKLMLASITWDASGVAGLAGLTQLHIPVVVGAGARGRAKAQSARLPFEIWRVAIVGHAAMTGATLDDMSIAYTDQFDQSSTYAVSHAVLADVGVGATQSVFVAAATHGTVTGTASFGDTTAPFTLNGPGTYFVESTGLTRAAEDPGAPAAWSCFVQGTDKLQLACRLEAAEGLSLQVATLNLTLATGEAKRALVIYDGNKRAYERADTAGMTTLTDPTALVVADLEASAFPLTVNLEVSLTGNPGGGRSNYAGEILGLGSLGSPDPFTVKPLKGSFTAQSPTDITSDVPYTLRMPFRLWPLTFSTTASFFTFTLDGYTVTAGADWDVAKKGDPVSIPAGLLPPLTPAASATTYYVAVDANVVSLKGTSRFGGNDEKPFTIPGPGAYVAQPDGLHAAAN